MVIKSCQRIHLALCISESTLCVLSDASESCRERRVCLLDLALLVLPLSVSFSSDTVQRWISLYCNRYIVKTSLWNHIGLRQIAEPHKVMLSSVVKCEFELLE